MEVFVLLKGYDFEGFGSNVEVFSTREAAETRKQQYVDGVITAFDAPDILYFIKAVTQNSALFEFLSKEGQADVLEYLDTQINIEKEFTE